MQTKICSKCKLRQSLDNFGPRPDSKDGHMGICHQCRNIYLQQRRIQNPGIDNAKWYKWAAKNTAYNKSRSRKRYYENIEIMREESAKYAREHREERRRYSRMSTTTLKGRIRNWKASAKSRGLEWSLNFAILDAMPKICFYTGDVLTFEHNYPHTISLDRLDSKKGYTIDNVVFCRSDINMAKRLHTVNDFLDLCKKVFDNKDNILKHMPIDKTAGI